MSFYSEFWDKKVLVTGGAGFIGSSLSKALLEYGAEVTILDSLATGQLELVPKEAEFIKSCVCNEELLRGWLKKFDYIFHLAANVLLNGDDPIYDQKINIEGALTLLEKLRWENKNSLKRIVYSSTSSVYGNGNYLPINESEEIKLLSPYSISKYAAENYFKYYGEKFNIPYSIVRYSNVYGPHQSPKNPYCGVISKFLDAKTAEINVHGTGYHTRDFTFIDDAVEATLLAAITPRAGFEIFNIGTGFETRILDLAVKCQNLQEWKEIKYLNRRDIDNISRRVLNIEKARRVLKWEPKILLGKGLEITLDWLEKQVK